jgi:hypothetical protein
VFYTINENERGHSEVKGSIIRHGRAIWRGSNQAVECEWVLLSKRVAVGIGLADYEDAISLRFCLWLFSFYLGWDNWKLAQWLSRTTARKGEKHGNGRTIGFSWIDGTLMVDLWNDPMEWRAVDPKWWHFSITPLDLFLGRAKYSERILQEGIRQLPLPERSYDVKITISESSWKRPRWPWPHKIVRTNAEVEGGIPVPGKGTADYNCGDDAIYSQTSPGATFDAAITGLFKSVMYAREHYPL